MEYYGITSEMLMLMTTLAPTAAVLEWKWTACKKLENFCAKTAHDLLTIVLQAVPFSHSQKQQP